MVRAYVLIGVTVGQGLIGLVQYATGVPEVLVVAHVLGADPAGRVGRRASHGHPGTRASPAQHGR